VPVDPQLRQVELAGQAAALALSIVLGAAHLGKWVDERQQHVEVDLLPIAEPLDDQVRSLIEHNRKRVDALAGQYPEAAAEVEMGQIGKQGPKLLMLCQKGSLAFEFGGQHAAGPYRPHRKQQRVLAPLPHRLHLHLTKRTVLQRPLQVLQ